MADQKPPEGQTPGNTGAESGGGTFENLGAMGEGEIRSVTNMVAKTSAEQGHEDLKNMAEHLKGDSGEASLDDLNVQDPGEGSLDDVNLQGIDQHQSKGLQWLAKIAKAIASTAASIMTKHPEGGMPGKPKSKPGPAIVAALVVLGIAAFVVVRFLVPGMMPPETTIAEPGPPQALKPGTPVVNMPVTGPQDKPVGWPPNPCGLQFENPIGPEGIPLSGPLDVQWSRLPGAASYEFRVIPPEGAGNPWLIATDGTSKRIYMENFPAAGQHTFALTALDRGGVSLCSNEVTFDKPAFGDEARQAREAEGAVCNTMGPCVVP